MNNNIMLGEAVVWLDPLRLHSAIYRVEGVGRRELINLKNKQGVRRVEPEELRKLDEVMVCRDCGNFHTTVSALVDTNTLAFVIHDESDFIWCNKCVSSTTIVKARDYYKDLSQFVNP